MLPFWLRYHISSTNVIVGLFALYYFSHKDFIRSKEEISTPIKTNFLILTEELSTLALSYVRRWLLSQKLRIVKSSRVHQKESVLKQTECFFILMTSSGNKHQCDYRFTDSFCTKTFEISKRNLSFKNKL